MNLTELKYKPLPELVNLALELACEQDIPSISHSSRQDLVLYISRRCLERNINLYGEGFLEILPDGFGFLRSSAAGYQSGSDDIYVSPSQIRLFSLRKGEHVAGEVRPPREGERYFALLKISTVGQIPTEEAKKVKPFDTLTAIYPNRPLKTSNNPKEHTLNHLLEKALPLGFGQRCLIHGENQSGKKTLFKQLSLALAVCQPKTPIFLLLTDQSHEHITEFKKDIEGISNIELASSYFDESPQRHVNICEMLLEKAKRMAERQQDIIIMLDSFTNFAKACNAITPAGARILAGGLEPAGLQRAKKFFAAARNLEEGGSISIITTAQSDSESLLEQVIFEEIRNMSNAYISLDKELFDHGVSPAIDFLRSFTQKSELLIGNKIKEQVQSIKNEAKELSSLDALKYLLKRI